MLVALTSIGGAIKVPAIIGSVALDSFPALLASVLIGGIAGGIVGTAGHLLSALLGGMPLGPLHGLIAVEMFFLAYLFGLFYRNGKKWLAGVLFVFGNTIIAPLPFIFFMSKAFYLSLIPSLFIGSFLNMLIAFIVIPRLVKVMESISFKERPSQ